MLKQYPYIKNNKKKKKKKKKKLIGISNFK